MTIEQDAERLINCLAYSLGDEPWPMPTALEMIRRVIAEIHAAASAVPGQPGMALEAARQAFGPTAAEYLSSLTGLQDPPLQRLAHDERATLLHRRLGGLCADLGGSVQDIRDGMEFVFRDFHEAVWGHPQRQQHLERVLHLALGMETAWLWHDICRLADGSRA